MPKPPASSIDTGKYLGDVRIYTDELLPNCSLGFVMSGVHEETKEPAWFGFCKKTGKIQKVGPYETFPQAVKYLNLTKGCLKCTFNKGDKTENRRSVIDEKVREELERTIGVELHSVPEPLRIFVESRGFFDINFDNKFGTRFFTSIPDDNRAIIDMMPPCKSEADFTRKVQALAGMIDRINEKEIRALIKNAEKQKLPGSINLLEQILKENYPSYKPYLISNLRSLMNLRSKLYPTHALTSSILGCLSNFEFQIIH